MARRCHRAQVRNTQIMPKETQNNFQNEVLGSLTTNSCIAAACLSNRFYTMETRFNALRSFKIVIDGSWIGLSKETFSKTKKSPLAYFFRSTAIGSLCYYYIVLLNFHLILSMIIITSTSKDSVDLKINIQVFLSHLMTSIFVEKSMSFHCGSIFL